MAGRISQFLSALRAGLVSDVPPEFQACESCRETFCDSAKAEQCMDRRHGEEQERSRRFDTPQSRSGTHEISTQQEKAYDVPSTRLGAGAAEPASSLRIRGTGEHSQSSDPDLEIVPARRGTRIG
jgi:hypothetical protein